MKHWWLRFLGRSCLCGRHKPRLSHVCDECWKHDPWNPDAQYEA